MKICLINNLYKPFNRGGAERIVELLSEGLKKNGDEAFIITTKPADITSEADIYRIKSRYFDLGKMPESLRLFWQLFNVFNFINYFKVIKILKSEKPDLVITNNLMGLGFLIPAAIKRLKIRHFHILHDIQLLHPSGLLLYGEEEKISSLPSKIYQKINSYLFKNVNLVISPSNWLLKEHRSAGLFDESESIILPNPVGKKIIFKSPLKNSRTKFLYVGQIEDHKGIIFLINAFININTGKAELTIVGSGDKSAEIAELAKEHYNIKIIGKKSSVEVEQLMKDSDCLIVPSLCYENSPTVIYEALSHDLPVIGSSLGGVPELLDENDRLLFKPKDGISLTEKINWAINHPHELQYIIRRISGKIEECDTETYIKLLKNHL